MNTPQPAKSLVYYHYEAKPANSLVYYHYEAKTLSHRRSGQSPPTPVVLVLFITTSNSLPSSAVLYLSCNRLY